MKRIIGLLLAVALALTLTISMAESPVQLYVLSVSLDQESEGLFDAFEIENNCEVILVPVLSEDFLPYFTVVVNGGAQLDVISINGQDVRGLAQKGMLYDLTETVDYLDRFYDATYKPFVIEDKLYAIPHTDGTSMAMFYNKELFEKAGVSEPTNWDELIECKKAFDSIGVGTLMHCGSVTYMWPSWYFATLRQTTGNKAVERTFEALEGKAKFTDPDFVEAMAILERLGKETIFVEGVNAYDRESSVQAFIDGKVAMLYTGVWDLSTFRYAGMGDDVLGIMPLPKFSEKAVGNLAYVTGAASGNALSIYSGTNHIDLSAKLIDYLTQTQQMTDQRFRYILEQDISGAVYAPIKDEIIIPDNVPVDPLGAYIADLVANTDVWLDWYWPSAVTDSFKEMIQAVVGGQIDANNAMIEIQNTLEDLYLDGYTF